VDTPHLALDSYDTSDRDLAATLQIQKAVTGFAQLGKLKAIIFMGEAASLDQVDLITPWCQNIFKDPKDFFSEKKMIFISTKRDRNNSDKEDSMDMFGLVFNAVEPNKTFPEGKFENQLFVLEKNSLKKENLREQHGGLITDEKLRNCKKIT